MLSSGVVRSENKHARGPCARLQQALLHTSNAQLGQPKPCTPLPEGDLPRLRSTHSARLLVVGTFGWCDYSAVQPLRHRDR